LVEIARLEELLAGFDREIKQPVESVLRPRVPGKRRMPKQATLLGWLVDH
jgi:hypothetical protein